MSKISLDFFQNDLNNKIKKICNNAKANDELEVGFGSAKKQISLKKFYNLLKFLKSKSLKDKLIFEKTTSLDLSYIYNQKTYSSFRLSINGQNQINNFIQNHKLLKNHTIFSKQIRMYISQDDKTSTDKIILINKIKSPEKFVALEEYDMRIKLSEEITDIEQSTMKSLLALAEPERHNMSFRHKQRVSLIIEDNIDCIIRIDLTDVKSSLNINSILESNSRYELEIDVTFKKSPNDKVLQKILDQMAHTMLDLEKFLQESHVLITKTESINVIKNLNKLAYDSESDAYKDLPAMQSASVEIQHILDYIPGNYTATDKADGERHFMMILDSGLYLISSNLDVKKIKILESSISTPYNQTVLDGEYLYINSYKKFLYLTFDILFFQGKDVRGEEMLKNRLLLVVKVLKDLFNVNLNIGIYTKDYDFNKICDFHKTNIQIHLDQLNKHLKDSVDNQVINGKYFCFPMTVGEQNEIYALTSILYEAYTLDSKLKCPYILDGVIYTPLNQKYTRNQKETKFKILKWKPDNTNSIDFYVRLERNRDTNKILTVYDRSIQDSLEDYVDNTKTNDVDFNDMTKYKVSNTVYQIANLYVGKIKNNQEVPVLFQRETENYQAFINLTDGYPRDIEGNIIQDATVVEFAYDDSIDNEKFRWIPLRTRFDKTESVIKYKRKYGNNAEIANRVWNSIQNPITFNDIKLLSNINTNQTHIKLLKTKVSAETISMIRRDDSYYQLVTNLGQSLRSFHNWIKSNMIYTYCSAKILLDSTRVGMDVLDIGVGRGGDLMKLYHAKIKSGVGIDVNEAGIFSGSDGAISRYNVFKKKMPGFPRMSFMVADAGQKFDYENQLKIGKMNEQNIKILKQVFGENERSSKHNTFDVINAQFMIHYLLANTNSWSNFCSNVNKYLRSDGYLLITTLDGQMLNNSFVDGHIRRDYISEDGKKNILFDIVKKYPNDLDLSKLNTTESNLGIQVDVHLPMFMDEGVYLTEYLVRPQFLINELKTKCNMRLVETESFQNLYHVYQDFFENTSKYESKAETRKFFEGVKEFYNTKDEITRNWFEYSKLNRYYIFQKK
jgi:hypothetical protein